MIIHNTHPAYNTMAERRAYADGIQHALILMAIRGSRADLADYRKRVFYWARDPDTGAAPPKVVVPDSARGAA